MFSDTLMQEIRDRFHHVENCPYQGKRVFFENAGGALTLKTVADTSAIMAAIPDNQGRDNPASHRLVDMIDQSKRDMHDFLGTQSGVVFVGESGTELLFRLIRTAIVGTSEGGNVLGSTLEHPASSSACDYWATKMNKTYVRIPHNNATGTVTVADYQPHITPDTRVATIIHTSPVTGMSTDVKAIAAAIREVSPECFIIVDGIQHAAHGGLSIDQYNIDGYAISPYKVFSRHGYGVAWASDRLCALPHERLNDTPDSQWELGTRDTAAYATFSDVVDYFDWLGAQFTNATDKRERITVAGHEIGKHEHALVQRMLHGANGQRGLATMEKINIIGGVENDCREGLVALTVEGVDSPDVVSKLSEDGIRVHVRKADHYSGNILKPLNLETCVRVSLCHYNSPQEVDQFLTAMEKIVAN